MTDIPPFSVLPETDITNLTLGNQDFGFLLFKAVGNVTQPFLRACGNQFALGWWWAALDPGTLILIPQHVLFKTKQILPSPYNPLLPLCSCPFSPLRGTKRSPSPKILRLRELPAQQYRIWLFYWSAVKSGLENTAQQMLSPTLKRTERKFMKSLSSEGTGI